MPCEHCRMAHQELDRLNVPRLDDGHELTVKGRITLLATGGTLPDRPPLSLRDRCMELLLEMQRERRETW
jgi:hypothetical protein